MNDFPESKSAQVDRVTEAVRRLRALHEVLREATTSEACDDDLRAIFADAERASTPSAQRIIIACDIEGSTAKMSAEAARDVLYAWVEKALLDCRITQAVGEPVHHTGNGVVTLVRSGDRVHQTLLHAFVPALSRKLVEHAALQPDRMFRLRVAIHAGEVHRDRRDISGEGLDIAFGLLNAPELKNRLRQTAAPLVLVVSERIHRSVIRHRYDERTFEPGIGVEVAGQRHVGWVQVPVMSQIEGVQALTVRSTTSSVADSERRVM